MTVQGRRAFVRVGRPRELGGHSAARAVLLRGEPAAASRAVRRCAATPKGTPGSRPGSSRRRAACTRSRTGTWHDHNLHAALPAAATRAADGAVGEALRRLRRRDERAVEEHARQRVAVQPDFHAVRRDLRAASARCRSARCPPKSKTASLTTSILPTSVGMVPLRFGLRLSVEQQVRIAAIWCRDLRRRDEVEQAGGTVPTRVILRRCAAKPTRARQWRSARQALRGRGGRGGEAYMWRTSSR